MQQLGGLDNLMIEGELPNIPMHMSALTIYETAGKRGANRMAQGMEERFDLLAEKYFPILRCRIEELPLDLDKGYWVEDPGFNLNYHFRRVALPGRKDWPALYELFGSFHAQPLDRSRPLWEVMLVEGLDQLQGIPRGSTAVFLKIHHAVMDGKSAQRLMSGFHSLDPDPDSPILAESMPAQTPGELAFESPSWMQKWGRAWWHSIERPIDLIGTMTKLLPGLLQGDEDADKSKGQGTPLAHFNHPVAADRVVGHVRMASRTLRRLEKKYTCTINDVALCVVAGALREFLLSRNELPEQDLRTLMPIDIRRKDKDGNIGNHVSVAKLSLYTTIENAGERLAAISQEASRGKKRSRKGDSHAMLNLVDDIHPAVILWLGRWLVSSGRIEKMPQSVNTVVTNVPGLSEEAYLAGSKLIDYLGFGPLAPNMGLFHTVSSTPDHVNVSFLSTAEFVDDGSVYRGALEQSWASVSRL